MNRTLLLCTALLVVTGCSKKPADVMDSDNGTQPIAKTTRCTVPNADGVRCDVKTCKADAASDCSTFKIGCTTYNHTYTGNNDSGTCTRGPIVGRNARGDDHVAAATIQAEQPSMRGRGNTPDPPPAG
jgi:hypothetical protein